MTKRESATQPEHQATALPRGGATGDWDERSRDDVLIAVTSGLWSPRPSATTALPRPLLLGAGTTVVCRGEGVGVLDHVLVDPDTDVIRALAVRRQCPEMAMEEAIVPVAMVETASEETIVLAADWTAHRRQGAAEVQSPASPSGPSQRAAQAHDGAGPDVALDRVDEASWESFPASDAPGWILES